MATTPSRNVKVIVGGSRTVLKSPAKWIDLEYGNISVQGQERGDNVVYVPKIGWRLLSVRDIGYASYDAGKDTDRILFPQDHPGLATYEDDSEPVKVIPNQRWLQELNVAQGTQTTSGDYVVHKNARKLGGLGSDWTSFPPPNVDEPVPLDRVAVGSEQLDADDRLHFSWGIHGDGSRTIGPVWRGYFPQIASTTKSDFREGRKGIGTYSLTLDGGGQALLHELTVKTSGQQLPEWRQRASFSYCESSRVIGNTHRITVEGDAQRDGNGRLYGTRFRISFSSLPAVGGFSQIADLALNLAEAKTGKEGVLDAAYEYRIPGASIDNQPVATRVRVEARQDATTTFQAIRTVFAEGGLLRVKTFATPTATADGLVHTQVFASIPEGTSINLRLYGARTNQECTVAATPVDHVGAKFVDFNAIPGERSYILNIEMFPSSDGLRSPTVRRVGFVREATFRAIEEPEYELKNVVSISTTGASADPSTETMGAVCYDLTGLQNAPLLVKAGMRIRAEIDLGPDPENPGGPHLKSVLFSGMVREAKRTTLAGKGRQGFKRDGADLRKGPLVKYRIKAVSEWEWLRKFVAPGRLNIAYDANAAASVAGSPPKPSKVSDIVRYLLLSILPANRVDVPDLPILFPFEQNAATSIEALQPVMSIAMSLWRDYIGGWIYLDHNASPPEGDPRGTTDEGMWRATIAPKRSKMKPLVEFWREPVVPNVVSVDPAAYPAYTATDGDVSRKVLRTFLRQGSDDDWIEPPAYNCVMVRGSGTIAPQVAQIIGNEGIMTVTLCNWKAAKFDVEGTGPAQGEAGGPPAPDPDSIDFTVGAVQPLIHSDPMLGTFEAVYFIARRLFDLLCHGKRWGAGESPLVLLTKETTNDPLQKNPRPLKFGDPVLRKGSDVTITSDGTGRVDSDGLFVMAEGPSILIDGLQGGSQNMQAYCSMYSAPPDDSYRAAYGDPFA